jgi:CheY-like chemotaxis protein
MNGYEICQTMRKEPTLQNTVFIAQTGWGKQEHRERSKEAGFDYHLVKPVDIAALEKILLSINTQHAA